MIHTSSLAEAYYQQGLHYARSTQAKRTENLRQALVYYKLALQYTSHEAFPNQWEQIQQAMAEAYREIVQMRLEQTAEEPLFPAPSRTWHLALSQVLLLGLIIIVFLAVPSLVIATVSLTRGTLSCVHGTLTLDGSMTLQPLMEAVAKNYMRRCPGTLITVGGGTSTTGLEDVERGHGLLVGINPQTNPGHLAGQTVPVEIGASDLFASPAQRDLVDHQIAIGLFAVIVNREVIGLHNLSTAQLQGIYTGAYQNWRQICDAGHCGPNIPIVPINSTSDSGTRVIFEKDLLKGVVTIPEINLNGMSTGSSTIREVERTPGSISYTSLYLANQAHDVITLSINGQNPHTTSLIDRHTYAFWSIEHLYTHGPGSPLARSFLAYLSSDGITPLLAHFAFLPLSAFPQSIRDDHVI